MNLLVVPDDHQILVLQISPAACYNFQKDHIVQTNPICNLEGLLTVRDIVHLHTVVVQNGISRPVRIEENLDGLVIQLARGTLASLHEVPHDEFAVGTNGQSNLVRGMNADRVHGSSNHHNE